MEHGMSPATTRLSSEEFLLFPEDGKLHELIDGEHLVSAAPHLRHQRIVMQLIHHIDPFIRARRLGNLYPAPLDVVLSEHDVVEPDLIFVSNDRSAIEQDRIRGAPDLVVEVLSPATRQRDEIVKRVLYERFGVAEYWLVDPEAETVKVYRLEKGVYGRVEVFEARRADVLTSPLLPDLEIPVSRLFV